MPGTQSPILIAHDCEPTVQLLASVQADNSYSAALALPETLKHRAVRLLARMLREDGFFVIVAEGSRDAMRRLARGPSPEALIVDVSLPRGNHMAVMRSARTVHPNVPIFVLTNFRELVVSCGNLPGIPPMLFTKPIEYCKFILELGRGLRRQSGQMLRVIDRPAASRTGEKKS